jgi:hypothetical protein
VHVDGNPQRSDVAHPIYGIVPVSFDLSVRFRTALVLTPTRLRCPTLPDALSWATLMSGESISSSNSPGCGMARAMKLQSCSIVFSAWSGYSSGDVMPSVSQRIVHASSRVGFLRRPIPAHALVARPSEVYDNLRMFRQHAPRYISPRTDRRLVPAVQAQKPRPRQRRIQPRPEALVSGALALPIEHAG